ncbi:hypothetical protein [Sodalis sp.]|uniref:hypothetical protein n=1 Tax=Sodalis sp. (in: enterobacteria) TaxID=1898979 RepID=UPI003872F9C2
MGAVLPWSSATLTASNRKQYGYRLVLSLLAGDQQGSGAARQVGYNGRVGKSYQR